MQFPSHRAVEDNLRLRASTSPRQLANCSRASLRPKTRSRALESSRKQVDNHRSFVYELMAYPFLLRLRVHRLEVELVVEVHGDDAVATLFALVIMDLSRRLRPHRSRPACLRCRSLESMRKLALDHDALIRRGVPVPARVHARGTFAGSPRRPRLDFPTLRISVVQDAWDRRASTE